ncbi:MAG: pyridoxal-phosphate dependent enzyme [Bryobacteraceae bacterium]|nr:pyridoxal-phosphate dependent enzyme [Bryobacteraceae bacterium]
MSGEEPAIGIGEIREAAERIRPLAHRTPVLTNRSFDQAAGVRAYFKCENFQRGGSFKIRGASNFVYSLGPDKARRGVVAYSSGNHAQAVAIAAESVGAAATLVMPADAPRSKVEATRAHGAAIVTYDRFKERREEIGRRVAKESGAELVPPYDHPWTIAGQGTTALEFLEAEADLDALLVPVGGGGLLAGCSIAAKSIKPDLRIFGVEPELANDTYLSFASGLREEIPMPATLADGLRATQPGAITFPIIRRNVEAILLVSEDEIKATVRFLLSRMKFLAEPSGAVAAAAVLHGKLPAGIAKAGIVISGGNVDLEELARY